MTEFVFLFNIVSLLLSAAAQVATWVLYRRTRSRRVFYFLMGNFLTFLILAVLTWDLYCSILGRDTRLRTNLWSLIDFCVCGLCAAIPHTIRPIKPARAVRAAELGFGAAAALLALLRLLSLTGKRYPLEAMGLYVAIYGLFSLALLYFGTSVLMNRKSFLSDAALRHYQRALDVTGASVLLLLPALIFVDFAGWLLPFYSRLVERGFSILPIFLGIMSVSIAIASALDVLEPIPVAGVDAVDGSFLRKYALSPREAELLPLLLRNLSYREIAEALFIAPGTVRTHVIHIYQKTGVGSRLELSRLVWSEHRGPAQESSR